MKNHSSPDTDRPERIVASRHRTQPSLRPDAVVMEAAAAFGQPEAVAIIQAWKFNQPVRTVSREEFAAMVEKGTVSFGG